MKNRDWYWNRAKKRFKVLVIYFCVTRPQYEKAYHRNGKFSLEELLYQMDFLETFNDRSETFRKIHSRQQARYSKTFNYTFGIPSELVKSVLGQWKDERGKTVRIPVNKLVKELEDENFIRVCKHGTKTRKDDEGKYHATCWWDTKYLLADRAYWMKLMSDEKYSDYMKYPEDNEGFVSEVRSKISKWKNRVVSMATTKNDYQSVLEDFCEGNISPKEAVSELERLGLTSEAAETAIRKLLENGKFYCDKGDYAL